MVTKMSKRDDYLKNLNKLTESSVGSIIKPSDNAVDVTIKTIEESIEIKKNSSKLIFNKKTELKSERRSYALKPSLVKKIKDMALDNGVSENEVVCKILEQFFEES